MRTATILMLGLALLSSGCEFDSYGIPANKTPLDDLTPDRPIPDQGQDRGPEASVDRGVDVSITDLPQRVVQGRCALRHRALHGLLRRQVLRR